MNAGTVRAPLEHQLAIRAPLSQQVGQALPIALLVHHDAGVVAAGGACAARNQPRISAPRGCQEKSRGVQSTERLSPSIALSFLPSRTAWMIAPVRRFHCPAGVSWWRLRSCCGSDHSVADRRATEVCKLRTPQDNAHGSVDGQVARGLRCLGLSLRKTLAFELNGRCLGSFTMG